MRGVLIKWVINSLAILIVTYIVKGIEVASPITAIVAAFVLGIINAFLRPCIILITLPINIFTLGVFTFFINGFLFYFVSKIVKGFVVTGFWPAFFGALLFSIISFLLSLLINKEGKLEIKFINER
ncbi:MAG: phage holin family protein [Candidatus Omnitrophota bacterium]|nr:phage holin family protein [Candidatus Omnitrophota bacterium]